MRATSLVLAAVALAALASAAQAAVIVGDAADAAITTGPSLASVTATDIEVGNVGGTTASVGVFVFQLPELGSNSNPFSAASFAVNVSYDGWFPNVPYDLYGLAKRASNTVLATDYFVGALDGTATLLVDNFVGWWGEPPAGETKSTSANSLLSYLNAQYADGAGAGQYVFVRLNPDDAPISEYKRLHVVSADASSGQPTIAYTIIPEPTTLGVLALAGVGLIARRRKA